MKKQLLILAVLIIHAISGSAQTFFTGFDTPAEQNKWTIYRLESLSSYNFTFTSSSSVSSPYSVYHDYPMNGAVEDWFISPKLVFTGDSSNISVYSKILAMSVPPDVYYGLWISFGSKSPLDGDYTEIADLTLFPAASNTWLDTGFTVPVTSDTGYVAIKYKAGDFQWLMLYFDNITVDSAFEASPSAIPDISREDLISVYPNPAEDKIYIDKSAQENITVEFRNIQGQLVKEILLSDNKTTVDIQDLSKGIYTIRLMKDQSVSVSKFIKL